MITSSKLEFVRTDDDGNKWWRVILTADAEPDTLELTGADVSDLASNVRFAAGSVLLTPSANYVAYVDGTFGGGGGGTVDGIISVTFSPDLGWIDLESATPINATSEPASYVSSNAAIYAETPISGETIHVTVNPSSEWYVYNDNDEVVGGKGESVTLDYVMTSNSDFVSFGVQDTEELDEEVTRIIQCNWNIIHGDI